MKLHTFADEMNWPHWNGTIVHCEEQLAGTLLFWASAAESACSWYSYIDERGGKWCRMLQRIKGLSQRNIIKHFWILTDSARVPMLCINWGKVQTPCRCDVKVNVPCRTCNKIPDNINRRKRYEACLWDKFLDAWQQDMAWVANKLEGTWLDEQDLISESWCKGHKVNQLCEHYRWLSWRCKQW